MARGVDCDTCSSVIATSSNVSRIDQGIARSVELGDKGIPTSFIVC